MEKHLITCFEGYKPLFDKIHKLKAGTVVFLSGDLGAGKTTFVQQYLKYRFNLKDSDLISYGVVSPTFSLINEYQIKEKSFFHCDFYRLENNEIEVEDVLETLESAELSFVEWGEKINLSSYISKKAQVKISILKKSDSEREVETEL